MYKQQWLTYSISIMQLFRSFSIILVLIKNKLFCILFLLCFPSTLRALLVLYSPEIWWGWSIKLFKEKFIIFLVFQEWENLSISIHFFIWANLVHALIYVYIIIDLAQILSCSKWISYSKTPFFLVDFKLTYQYCWVAVDEKH